MIDDFTNDVLKHQEGKLSFDSLLNPSNEAYDCYNRVNSSDPTEAFRWMPVYDATVTASNPVASWSGLCYDNI